MASKKASAVALNDLVEEEAAPGQNFPIVGIGASAGGLAAFESFFAAMPALTDRGMAFVLVQHLAPGHKSALAELVTRYTRMQVNEVQDGVEVKPGQVYVIPPNRDLVLMNGKLHLFEADNALGVRPTIDNFFRSLAADQKHRAVCIIMSGTGSDGVLGVRAIKGEGGLAIAQTPSSTEFDGMPRSAIATGLIDYVLTPDEMPARLISYLSRSFAQNVKGTSGAITIPQDIIAKVCVLLRARTGRDFSQYKQSTVIRRVERRMALQQIERPADYLRFLQQSGDELEALFRDLLIGVTSFFRDAAAFSTFETEAIPRMFDELPKNAPLRAWVCGCSTGEEAYSVAILLHEYLERTDKHSKVQIFATDIDARATDRGRRGVFPPSISADVSPERLMRFFTRESGGAHRIAKSIRDSVIFSEQDAIQDPAFSRLSLISCRNLMIYMNAELQQKLIRLFHYAMNPGGVLFLGNSETVGDHSELFEAVDRKARIYLRRNETAIVKHFPIAELTEPGSGAKNSSTHRARALELTFRELSEQTILRNSGLAGLLVNGHGEILYFYGQNGTYLEPAPGNASANIFTMAREELRRELAMALQSAIAKKQAVQLDGLLMNQEICLDISILPVEQPESSGVGLFFVQFERKPLGNAPSGQELKPELPLTREASSRIGKLERELRLKEDYVHTIIEEMATSSEELRSSNEELQSINEEMQSTNEELEMSKEELQSLNEELSALNAELVEKVASLSCANSDMNNLLAGTGIATLFLDGNLQIARFTPAVSRVVNLIPADIGRPLSDITSRLFDYDDMIEDAWSVLDNLTVFEREAQTKEGEWFLVNIRPYRTLENVVDGVVITFVNITAQRTMLRNVKGSGAA